MSYADTKPAGLPPPPVASPTPPQPVSGLLWYNTVTKAVSLWDGSAWVGITGANGRDGIDGKTYAPTIAATAPTNKTKGDIWLDTATNIAQMWDGAAWQPISTPPSSSVENGNNDMEILTWDSTAQKWVATVNELGMESNINGLGDLNNDGSALVYDYNNNEFNFQKFIPDLTGVEGDSMIWDDVTATWIPGQAIPAIKPWDTNVVYPMDATVYHNEHLWKCLKSNSQGVEPAALPGSVRVSFTPSGGSAIKHNVVPLAINMGTALGTAPTIAAPLRSDQIVINYVDATHWEIWYSKVTLDFMFRPQSAAWTLLKNYTMKIWWGIDPPPTSVIGKARDFNAVMWIFDEAAKNGVGTTLPSGGQSDWRVLWLNGFLSSLHDVETSSVEEGDFLTYTKAGVWSAASVFVDPPASKNAAGKPGQIAFDATHLYICVATNSWTRYDVNAGGW